MKIIIAGVKPLPKITFTRKNEGIEKELDKQAEFIFSLLVDYVPSYVFKRVCKLIGDYRLRLDEE